MVLHVSAYPPADFPSDLYEQVNQSLKSQPQGGTWKQFAAAWNAVRYRYAATVEFDDAFTTSIKAHGVGPAEPYRYQQERDLFCFTTNATSTFDAFYYALYSIGAMLKPNDFLHLNDPDTERNITVATTRSQYFASFRGDPVLQDLEAFSKDTAFSELVRMRNILVHRAAPPRNFNLGDPKEPAARLSRLDVTLDERTTSSKRLEVHRLLNICLTSAASFTSRHCVAET